MTYERREILIQRLREGIADPTVPEEAKQEARKRLDQLQRIQDKTKPSALEAKVEKRLATSTRMASDEAMQVHQKLQPPVGDVDPI